MAYDTKMIPQVDHHFLLSCKSQNLLTSYVGKDKTSFECTCKLALAPFDEIALIVISDEDYENVKNFTDSEDRWYTTNSLDQKYTFFIFHPTSGGRVYVFNSKNYSKLAIDRVNTKRMLKRMKRYSEIL